MWVAADTSDYAGYPDSPTSAVNMSDRDRSVLSSFLAIAMQRRVWNAMSDTQWDNWSSYLATISSILDG